MDAYPIGTFVDRPRGIAPSLPQPGSPTPLDHGGLLMERSTIIAGFGGQGILFAGKVLAEAALLEGREVLWIPSYGPEMRGGTASCTVIVADRPIGSPIVDRADHAVVLNPPSMAKYAPLVAVGGLLVVNTTLIEAEPGRDDIEVIEVPVHRARPAGRRRQAGVGGGAGRARRTRGGSWSPTACTARSRSCSGPSDRS